MPSVSRKQHNLMEAAAHTKGGFGGVPQSVGKDFAAADKGKDMKHLPEHESSEAHDSNEPLAEHKGQHSEGKESAPVGHKTGGGASFGMAEHHQRSGEGKAHGFSGTHKDGHHRVSGHKGAHQLGKK